MNRICSNCGNKQGPFLPIQILFHKTAWVCKNTKQAQNRITECVEKRAKSDADKYKELLHPYDVA